VPLPPREPAATARPETTAKGAAAGGPAAIADAFFAALGGGVLGPDLTHHRAGKRIAARAARPAGYQDDGLAALAGELPAAPAEA
jgi:hypothetical protein